MNADQPRLAPRFLHGELTRLIVGVFYDVYNELGYGFLESVYERAMQIALEGVGLSVRRQARLDVTFRGTRVGRFKIDLLVESAIAVELKARSAIADAHVANS
jgi:GxxExxY protein